MKGSFLLNMLAILAGLLGIMVLGEVSLSDSSSLYRLLVAAVLFLCSWQLFVRGLAEPADRRRQRTVHSADGRQGDAPARRRAA